MRRLPTRPTLIRSGRRFGIRPVLAAVGALALSGCQLYSVYRDPTGRAEADMQTVVHAYEGSGAKPVHGLTVAQARAQPTMQDAARAVMAAQHKTETADERAVTTRDLQVDGAAGPLAARLYDPAPTHYAEPIVLFFHGGGGITGDLDGSDLAVRALAAQAHAKILSVSYRLAPENRFPAAEDDAVAAYRWLLANAASLGADPRRIAVAGEMLGANMAINVSIAARDQHFTPPVHELLIDPIAGTEFRAPSYIADENAVPLGRADMGWVFANLTRSPADLADPRLDLIGHDDLHNLPPTTIVSAEIDPLESDGRFLTGKLRDAGNTVDRTEFGGTTHDFFGMGVVVERASEAEAFAAQGLDGTFDQIGNPPPPPKPRPVARRAVRRYRRPTQ